MGSKQDTSPIMREKMKRHPKMSETERLIRDTILHESKSISQKATSLVVNGLLDFAKPRNKSIARNSRASEVADNLVCKQKKRKIDEESIEEHNLRGEIRSNNNLNGISVLGLSYWNSKNPLRDAGEGDHIICQKIENYMKIVLNNTARHNVLTANVSCVLLCFS